MRDIGPFIGLVAVVMLFSIPMVAIISSFCGEALKTWLEIGLKRDMVARGYTAQEIIEVLAAKSDSRRRINLPDVPPAKPIKQPIYSP